MSKKDSLFNHGDRRVGCPFCKCTLLTGMRPLAWSHRTAVHIRCPFCCCRLPASLQVHVSTSVRNRTRHFLARFIGSLHTGRVLRLPPNVLRLRFRWRQWSGSHNPPRATITHGHSPGSRPFFACLRRAGSSPEGRREKQRGGQNGGKPTRRGLAASGLSSSLLPQWSKGEG